MVDLEARTVATTDGAIRESFEVDDYTRWRMLQELDDISITLSYDDKISAYEATRPTWK
jgi:3-isopropylmalate/(R)-2-methylmalate dehydratase small subunit